MALVGSYSEKAFCQYDQACPSMDTSGKKELRKAQNNMEKITEAGAQQTGLNWGQMEGLARDRGRWISLVDDLCSNGNISCKSVS